MALDTRDKRDSAIHIGLPWRARFPVPDGSINAGDRLHFARLYRGIAAATPTVAEALTFPLLHGADNRFPDLHGADNRFPLLYGFD